MPGTELGDQTAGTIERPLGAGVEPADDEMKKKLTAAESNLADAKKKLAAIKQELAPYKDLLKINWKLLD